MEFTINVNLTASPALEALLEKLAGLTAPVAPAPVPAPAATPAPVVSQPAPAVAPVPTPAPVPLAAAPGYTFEQLAQAGAAISAQGKQAEAMALLAQFGVQSLTQLPKEQYGAQS